MDEILSDDPHAYLDGIGRCCAQIHAALYQSYIDVPDRVGAAGLRRPTEPCCYNIRHVTRFDLRRPPISESVMEARMQPRTDARSGASTSA